MSSKISTNMTVNDKLAKNLTLHSAFVEISLVIFVNVITMEVLHIIPYYVLFPIKKYNKYYYKTKICFIPQKNYIYERLMHNTIEKHNKRDHFVTKGRAPCDVANLSIKE